MAARGLNFPLTPALPNAGGSAPARQGNEAIMEKMTGDAGRIEPRTGSPSPRLPEEEFRRRFRSRFADPAFEPLGGELDAITDAAWDAYSNHRKSPHTHPAGEGYADPSYELSDEWRAARGAIEEAQRVHDNPSGPTRLLLSAPRRAASTAVRGRSRRPGASPR